MEEKRGRENAGDGARHDGLVLQSERHSLDRLRATLGIPRAIC